jgi:TPR repeat protein
MLIIVAWGDADALAEAGFCYAQGVGCKKDLKKSAKFYRQAEAKGISMIGNSWYVLIASNSSVRLTVN